MPKNRTGAEKKKKKNKLAKDFYKTFVKGTEQSSYTSEEEEEDEPPAPALRQPPPPPPPPPAANKTKQQDKQARHKGRAPDIQIANQKRSAAREIQQALKEHLPPAITTCCC
jgi:hypothetical protein